MKPNSGKSLCYRCEHRACFLETGVRPRHECGAAMSVISCYMYRPAMPVLLKRQKGDNRKQFAGWAFSARSEAVGMPDMDLAVRREKNGSFLYWEPKEDTLE